MQLKLNMYRETVQHLEQHAGIRHIKDLDDDQSMVNYDLLFKQTLKHERVQIWFSDLPNSDGCCLCKKNKAVFHRQN